MALRGCRSALGVAARRVAGYEYNYRFSVDDEIAQLYKFEIHSGKKTYLFEIRTNFIMKTIDNEDQIIDSERFDGRVNVDDIEAALIFMVEYRLAEYWMTKQEISRLVHEASDFAIQTANDPENTSRLLIPIVVHLDVCTVQQENETVDSVSNRAITSGKLVPFYIWPIATGVDWKQFDNNLLIFLLSLVIARAKAGDVVDQRSGIRPRIRVEDVEEGLSIMPLCDICSQGPMIGNFISVLPSCNHAFHTHCIVRRLLLEKNYFCPTCQVRAYPYIHRRPA